MRRVGSNARSWVFTLTEKERDFLVAVLQAYPAIPTGYQPLSRESAGRLSHEDQQLLGEALLEHRGGSRTKVRRWLKGGARFRQVDDAWQFRLARNDFDWMMQILNDVRVGNWIELGSPDDIHEPIELLEKDPAAFFHMEAAGMFQMQFLEAVREPDGEPAAE
jgi:hypothetical protein